jgi:hypothetical protein
MQLTVKIIDDYGTGKDAIHIMREVMLEDVATPREWLETPTISMPPVTFPPHPRRPQFAGIGLYT